MENIRYSIDICPQKYWDKEKKKYRYFDDSFIDNCPILKWSYERMNKKTPLTKSQYWAYVHDMPINVAISFGDRILYFLQKIAAKLKRHD